MIVKNWNPFRADGAHNANCTGCALAATYVAGTPIVYHDPTNEQRQRDSSGTPIADGTRAVIHHSECHGDDEPTAYALIDGDTIPVSIDGVWDEPAANYSTWTVAQ